jgi:inorganic pyrophosphatase
VLGVYQLLNIPAGTRIKYLLEKKNTKLAVIEFLKTIHTSLMLIWVQG